MRKPLAFSLSVALAALAPGLAPYEAAAQVLVRPLAPSAPELPLGALPQGPGVLSLPSLGDAALRPATNLPTETLSAAPEPSPERKPGILTRVKAARARSAAKKAFFEQAGKVEEKLYIDRAKELADRLGELEKNDPAGAQAMLDGEWDGSGTRPDAVTASGAGEQVSGRPAAAPRRESPALVRVLGAAAVVVAVDAGARMLLPQIFGFSPSAAAWAVLSLGSVALPALAAVRYGLSKDSDPKLDPLKKGMDRLLGAALGGLLVTGVSLAPGGLGAALQLALSHGAASTGHVGLAPLLGLFSLTAALPYTAFSGQVGWALKARRPVELSLPIQPVLKLFLLPLLFAPALKFAVLTGGAAITFAPVIGYLAFSRYFKTQQFLQKLTLAQASPEFQAWAMQKMLAKKMLRQGVPVVSGPDPLPPLGRGMSIQGRDAPAAPDVRRAGLRSLAALGLLAAGSLGLVALWSLAGATAWPSILPELRSLAMNLPILLVMPLVIILFSRGKRVKTGPLFDMVKELAEKAKLPMPRVYMAKWKKPNAFATGFFHHAAVVAAAGPIMELLDPREMRAVMAHELSHVKYYHMLYFLPALVLLQYLPGSSVNLLQGAVTLWATLAWTFLFSRVSRANETQADHGGAKLSEDPAALASALRKLTIYGALRSGLPPGTGNPIYRALLSHPETQKRVQALDEMAKKP